MCRFGEDHRSLTDVLQDLQGQLKGQEPKLLPGQTLSRPLHVILQVSLRGSMLLMNALHLLWQELSISQHDKQELHTERLRACVNLS